MPAGSRLGRTSSHFLSLFYFLDFRSISPLHCPNLWNEMASVSPQRFLRARRMRGSLDPLAKSWEVDLRSRSDHNSPFSFRDIALLPSMKLDCKLPSRAWLIVALLWVV